MTTLGSFEGLGELPPSFSIDRVWLNGVNEDIKI